MYFVRHSYFFFFKLKTVGVHKYLIECSLSKLAITLGIKSEYVCLVEYGLIHFASIKIIITK